MWKDFFKFIKLAPGKVDTAMFGLIDFSRDDIPVEKIQKLFENDFPYLELTPLGKQKLYGVVKDKIDITPIPPAKTNKQKYLGQAPASTTSKSRNRKPQRKKNIKQ